MAERTGIFGSAFDPPHNAHLILAETARITFRLDRLVYIPTRVPPHKNIESNWDERTRSLMIRVASFSEEPSKIALDLKKIPSVKKDPSSFIAIYTREYKNNHDPAVTVSDIEIDRAEVSYSIDTVKAMKQEYPDTELHLIIGMDQAVVFDSWKDWKELPKLARICAGNRPGYDASLVREKYPFIEIFAIPPSAVSSTLVREKIAKQESISGFVPKIIEEMLKLF